MKGQSKTKEQRTELPTPLKGTEGSYPPEGGKLRGRNDFPLWGKNPKG